MILHVSVCFRRSDCFEYILYINFFLQGKQGPVEHIHRGILFIYDRHYLEHSGFICAKAQSCFLVGGSTGSHRGNVCANIYSRVGQSLIANINNYYII